MIALYLFLQCSLAFEDVKWSRGDSGRPARAHEVRVVFNCHERDAKRVD